MVTVLHHGINPSDQSQASEVDKAAQAGEDMALGATEGDYHALSQKEEADLENLMGHCEDAISNAEAFADQLSKDLSGLDGVCCPLQLFVGFYSPIGKTMYMYIYLIGRRYK